MIELYCPKCIYTVRYRESSLDDLKDCVEQGRKGGFDCPRCRKFGLHIRKVM